MEPYIGQKIWIKPQVQGRVVEINDDTLVVREDHRFRVDGPKTRPIYDYHRNVTGQKHTLPRSQNC